MICDKIQWNDHAIYFSLFVSTYYYYYSSFETSISFRIIHNHILYMYVKCINIWLAFVVLYEYEQRERSVGRARSCQYVMICEMRKMCDVGGGAHTLVVQKQHSNSVGTSVSSTFSFLCLAACSIAICLRSSATSCVISHQNQINRQIETEK